MLMGPLDNGNRVDLDVPEALDGCRSAGRIGRRGPGSVKTLAMKCDAAGPGTGNGQWPSGDGWPAYRETTPWEITP